MGALYPDYQAPIPSMTVLQLQPSPSQTHTAALSAEQAFETAVEQMPACQFRTPGGHQLAPISITEAKFENSPFEAPRPVGAEDAQSVIRIRLKGPVSLQEIDASLPALLLSRPGSPES